MNEPSTATNALANETSPYLRQHAANPVDWLPWGATALRRAQEQDKPILLSVGYSACHWCHVMAHESFEDALTAKVMNELFVNIKVDREERPDIDKIYQNAHQLLTRRPGGWPLTMFLTPDDQAPFFGGTYFPDRARFGMPAFRDVLTQIAQFYRSNQTDIRAQNTQIIAALQTMDAGSGTAARVRISSAPLEQSRIVLEQSFDAQYAGFGQAPKFPHPTSIERLLRTYASSRRAGNADEKALLMATNTLRAMCRGGVYDQLGGGFYRYSVDDQWMIPHFEKMLYDNGPLIALAAQTWQLTAEPLFERVTHESADWVIRDMQSPEGGYYSTLDADSEGVEGKFYVWTPREVRKLLGSEEFKLFAPRFGLDREPNFEGQEWHLHTFQDLDRIAEQRDTDIETAQLVLDGARRKLLTARNLRKWPDRDEKILTSWNALMIKAMCLAGLNTGSTRYLESAERALAFVKKVMWQGDRLLATYKDGHAHLNAYLDDYAFLLDAVLQMLSVRWRNSDFRFARTLAEALLERFEDRQAGGFYFTADDHEKLLCRTKSFMDDALPAGNGVAAVALGRLGHLLGESRYLDASEAAIEGGWTSIEQYPHAHNGVLDAVEEYLYPPQTIVLRGEGDVLASWLRRCHRFYAPGRYVIAIDNSIGQLDGLLAEREPRGTICAYVCEGHQCDAPIDDYEQLETVLSRFELTPASY